MLPRINTREQKSGWMMKENFRLASWWLFGCNKIFQGGRFWLAWAAEYHSCLKDAVAGIIDSRKWCASRFCLSLGSAHHFAIRQILASLEPFDFQLNGFSSKFWWSTILWPTWQSVGLLVVCFAAVTFVSPAAKLVSWYVETTSLVYHFVSLADLCYGCIINVLLTPQVGTSYTVTGSFSWFRPLNATSTLTAF